jgi:hypothetical protein
MQINRVYTFGVTPICIKVQVIEKNEECVVAGATQAGEVMEDNGRVLVLKNAKNEIIGKFNAARVDGWWTA